MVVAGRKRSIAFFIALGAGVVTFILLLYVGWVLLNWQTGILVFFGVLVVGLVISGVVLNTTFLVREIRRNEQHDAFINAVTHELKTPLLPSGCIWKPCSLGAWMRTGARNFIRLCWPIATGFSLPLSRFCERAECVLPGESSMFRP